MDFCNGMRQIVGARFRFAFNFSKSLCNGGKDSFDEVIIDFGDFQLTASSASFNECVEMPPVLFRLLRL